MKELRKHKGNDSIYRFLKSRISYAHSYQGTRLTTNVDLVPWTFIVLCSNGDGALYFYGLLRLSSFSTAD